MLYHIYSTYQNSTNPLFMRTAIKSPVRSSRSPVNRITPFNFSGLNSNCSYRFFFIHILQANKQQFYHYNHIYYIVEFAIQLCSQYNRKTNRNCNKVLRRQENIVNKRIECETKILPARICRRHAIREKPSMTFQKNAAHPILI